MKCKGTNKYRKSEQYSQMLLRQYAESCLQTVIGIRNKLSLKTQKSNRRKKKLKRRKNFSKRRFNIDESAFGFTGVIKGH